MEPPLPSPRESEPRASLAPRLWRDLREAVRGSEQDFTTGSLRRAVFLLAVPMVLEMALESVFAVVDVFFVARLGADAVATVGLTEAVLTLVFAVAIGLSTATTAMVARRIGEKDADGAARAAVQALLLGVLVSLLLGGAGALLAPRVLRWMGASPAIVASGSGYTAVLLGGCASVVLLFLGNAVFRGAGDAAVAMRVLWFANLLNIVLDPCFIFGLGPFPELGVTGAAVATTVGRGLGVVYQLTLLARGRGRLRIRREHLRLEPQVMARLLRVSLGGIGQYLVATASWVALVRIMALFGSAALAGYTIAVRIIVFTILPSWGLSNAAATLVGQNLGAGQPERAARSVWITAHYNMAFLTAVAVVFWVFADPMVLLFTADPEVLPVAAQGLRWVALCYPAYAYGLVMVQAFNGAGDTDTPTALNFACYWIWQIPVAWVLARSWGLGARGVYLAIASSEILLAAGGVLLFRRGSWKARQV